MHPFTLERPRDLDAALALRAQAGRNDTPAEYISTAGYNAALPGALEVSYRVECSAWIGRPSGKYRVRTWIAGLIPGSSPGTAMAEKG